MKIILLDSRNLVFRMGFAHKYLTSSDGTGTGVLYGVTGLLVRLKRKFADAKFVAVWDGDSTRGNCWRSKLYPAYKANRVPGTEEDQKARHSVIAQIPLLKELFDTLYIPQLEVQHMEADDVISIFSFYLRDHQFQPFIYSSDKDFCQLLHRGIQLIRDVDKSIKFKLENEEDTQKHFGCTLQNVLKARAFLGDPSDGIDSVFTGVGPVGANKYLACGVDPAIAEFKALPASVQVIASKLQERWEILHRNYSVLQLVESNSDARLTGKQQIELQKTMLYCLARLRKRTRINKDDYNSMLKFLSAYELQEAIQNRHELLQIQEI